MMETLTNLLRKAGDFIHCMGDAHIYSNHVSALSTQITRHPKPFPKVAIVLCERYVLKSQQTFQVVINDALVDLDSVTAADITLIGYEPHGKLDMTMAV
jgi:thymidylate synthase